MLHRISLAALGVLVLAVRQPACASPITFDFTGTGGVSGSFTINGDPTVPSGESLTGSPWKKVLLTEGGTDVSLTVNMGGKILAYSNSPSNPWEVQTFVSVGYPGGSTSDTSLTILGQAGDLIGNSNQFRLQLLVPTTEASLANLRTFGTPIINAAQPSASSGWAHSVDPQTMLSGSGTLTSVQLVSTPEPGSIVVFSTIAIAAVVQARRSRRRGPDASASPDFPGARS